VLFKCSRDKHLSVSVCLCTYNVSASKRSSDSPESENFEKKLKRLSKYIYCFYRFMFSYVTYKKMQIENQKRSRNAYLELYLCVAKITTYCH
jgi:hypothetical protein